MAAPKGNTYWKLAKGFDKGKEKKFTPEELWSKALSYFEWVEKNPLKEEKVFGTGVRMSVNKMRAMTLKTFCLFANIDKRNFDRYDKDEAYRPIIARVRDIIYTYKLEGAAADLLNPNIIARELGLSEKTESKIDSTLNIEVSSESAKGELEKLAGKLKNEDNESL